MQLATQDRAAKKYGLHYTNVEREKTLNVFVPAIALGEQRNIYLPYDNDIRNAIITGIQINPANSTGPALAVVPNTYNGNAAFPYLPLAELSNFVLTIVNRFGIRVWDQFPARMLTKSSVFNQDVFTNCCFTFEPGMSFFSYFDTSHSYNGGVISISFRYKSLIAKL